MIRLQRNELMNMKQYQKFKLQNTNTKYQTNYNDQNSKFETYL